MIQEADWHGCYDEGWKGMIVDDAFSHPAKMSYALAARIYEHAFKAGWLRPGDTVVDPFGGICGTAIHAAIQGVRWIGCELEPKFHELGNQNIDLWQRTYGHYPEWMRPTLYCGDSRQLCDVLGLADLCVSSPPFCDGGMGDSRPFGGIANKKSHWNETTGAGGLTDYGKTPGQLGSMSEGSLDAVVSSPPFADQGRTDSRLQGGMASQVPRTKIGGSPLGISHYGETAGQLGTMKEGDIDAVLSSPPYAGSVNAQSHGIDWSKCDPSSTGNRKRGPGTKHEETFQNQLSYGDTSGQLGAMPEGAAAVVGSPPFEGSMVESGDPNYAHKFHGLQNAYGASEGQLGNNSGETFWSASCLIVEQCHQIIRPGGHAIWVCKDFVRKGQRVPFSDQWLALCEAVGFRLVCRHRAMLVKQGGTQRLLDGGTHTTTKERKSFFRRLAEKKGSPRIDWEDVICVQKIHST